MHDDKNNFEKNNNKKTYIIFYLCFNCHNLEDTDVDLIIDSNDKADDTCTACGTPKG